MAAAIRKQPRYEGMESMSSIIGYILEDDFPKELTKDQRRKLVKKASSFFFLEGVLYQHGKDQVSRRVTSTKKNYT